MFTRPAAVQVPALIAITGFSGLGLTFFSESLVRGLYTPQEFETQVLFRGLWLNCAIYAFMLMVAFLVSRHFIFSLLLTSGLVLLVSAGHGLKLRYLHEPLYLSDFFLSAILTTAAVLPGLGNGLLITTLGIALAAVLVLWAVLTRQRLSLFSLRLQWTLPLTLAFSILPLGYCLASEKFFIGISQLLRLESTHYNKLLNFRHLGVAGGLAFDLRRLLQVQVPDGYSEFLRSTETHAADSSIPSGKYDNVVILLLESFWDPTALPGVKLQKDPISSFHGIAKKSTSGNLIVPSYGGGTIKTEFEILTGLSMAFVRGFPYNVAIRRETPTLATIFRKHGYRTVFLHGHKKWFYGRHNIVPLLGFGEFIAEDELRRHFSPHKIDDGRYIRDGWIARMIVEELGRSQKNFIFASTYVTHGPFIDRRNKVENYVTAGVADRVAFNQNLALLAEADSAISFLVNEVRKRYPRTLLVVFGDHYPSPTYLNTDFFSLHRQYLDAFRMPYFIDGPGIANDRIEIGAHALGGKILGLAGFPLRGQFLALAEIHQREPAFSHLESLPDSRGSADRRLFGLVQYDVLYGEKAVWR